MVKIWYSVFGEGLGHAMRSASIIEHLIKKHDMIITAGDKAYPFLKKKFGNKVYKIKSAHFVIENNEVNITKTIMTFINNFEGDTKKNTMKTFNLIRKFVPDLVISDFEPVSHYFASILKIPIVSIDNIQSITKCEIDFDKRFLPLYYASCMLINTFQLKSDYYFICALTDLKSKEKNVMVLPPVIRDEVLKARPKESSHVLVYQTSPTNSVLIENLKKISDEKFIFYGMDIAKKEKNIIFKRFSAKNFIDDLSSSRAAILNGGFTGVSEAIFLKKPILIVPVKNQFEQVFNGESVKKMNIGDWHEVLDEKTIRNFLEKIPLYKSNLKKIPEWDNNVLFSRLDEIVDASKKKKYFLLPFLSSVISWINPKKVQRTLTIIKPDAIEAGKIGEVIIKLEKQNIRPVGMKMVKMSESQAKDFYSHLEKTLPEKVFKSILDYMSSEKVIVMVWEGKGVVKKVRNICGPTDPQKAKKYHIRHLSRDSLEKRFQKGQAVRNIIHSSSDRIEAEKEINFFFKEEELKS